MLRKFVVILISSFVFFQLSGSSGAFTAAGQAYPGTQVIVVYGDSRSGKTVQQKIINDIIGFHPTAVFHTGDLVGNGLDPAEWTSFNAIISGLLRTAEFYPALGNHELNSPLFFKNFRLPNNGRWYSVDKSGIHFIVLDTNSDINIGSEQYRWLEKNLKDVNKSLKFIVAVFHHPLFSTGRHGSNKVLRNLLVPLFEKYGVNIVFSGHDHDYERSLYHNIYYIVTGGGGAPLGDRRRSSPYSQVFKKTYHFCCLSVKGGRLVVEVYDIDLGLIDRFESGPRKTASLDPYDMILGYAPSAARRYVVN